MSACRAGQAACPHRKNSGYCVPPAPFSITEGEKAVLFARPGTRSILKPIYTDGFTALGTIFKFTRRNGRVDGFLVTSGRVRNLRFDRTR